VGGVRLSRRGAGRPWRTRAAGVAAAGVATIATVATVVTLAQGSPPSPYETTFFDAADHAAIRYGSEPANDPVARLARDLERGTRRLTFDARLGYLPSLLESLGVAPASQLAVFSRTSLQAMAIRPQRPRMIYFNDSTVVAVPRAGFIEIAAQDPRQGVAFYTLEQRAADTPRFERPGVCLTCHLSYATLNVPGLLVRSVATDPEGRALPHLANGTSDHRTPLSERWGGWYVTGQTGTAAHLGNTMVPDPNSPGAAARPRPSSLASLTGTIGGGEYLTPHSDVAALLVFNHQMHLMNLLTRIGWQARVARADRDPAAVPALRDAAVAVVDYMLFIDEARLPGPVQGTSGFAEAFAARGPRDRQGRSLRQLDLTSRLLRYPCSYLIYSDVFDALPAEAKDAIHSRLWQVLSGAETSPRYARLTAGDRRAIVEILRETKPDLPGYFH
jgi:hypothetical protein